MGKPRVWLITGASSGFGRSLTELLLSRGDIVVATLRRPEVLRDLTACYSEYKLLVLKVDVTDPTDVDRAFALTREVFGRLDVVFNNAGSAIVGEAEMTPIEQARALFDVNFWGAVHVSRASVKFFRDANEPRWVVVSALEGFSRNLHRELLPKWNIKICILQIGSFDTNGLTNALILPESAEYYDNASPFAALRNILTAPGFRFEGDPNKLAKVVYSFSERKSSDIPLHLPMGQDALMLAKEVAELRQQEISGAAPLSIDLLRDDL